MILAEKHHIKPHDSNWSHCDFLSYSMKNLYNSCLFFIRQEYFKLEKHKKSLIGLSSVCGLDMAAYIKQNSFIFGKRTYSDKENNIKFTNQYSFDFVYLNRLFLNSIEYKTKNHEDYIKFQQDSQNYLNSKISFYENLTKMQYWDLRNKNKQKTNKKIKSKSFQSWKNNIINQLKKQLIIPIDINTKILKQTQRQVSQDFSNYFTSLKAYNNNSNKFLGKPGLPNYKFKGSQGRTVVTVPKEAISYVGAKKIVGSDILLNKVSKYEQRFIKQSQLGVVRIKNEKKYHISIANMNIVIESTVSKEQIKEIKIIPKLNPKVNGYQIIVLYEDNKDTMDTKNPQDNKVENNEIKQNLIKNQLTKFVEEIQAVQSHKIKEKKQKELTQFIKKNNLTLASIDLGINNFMTVTTTNPNIKPIMVNGRAVKSMNQWYNKIVSKEKSKLSKHNLLTSKKIQQLTNKRNQQMDNALHQASSQLVNWLKENKISALIIGKNINWKQESNIGKINNQKFVQIPHAKLIEKIQYKCKQIGITVILQEEAYTSKCSFLDLDDLPMYGRNNDLKPSGKRIHRGLYKSKENILINADLNGSLNILRKVIGNELFKNSNLIVDWAVNPERINLKGW